MRRVLTATIAFVAFAGFTALDGSPSHAQEVGNVSASQFPGQAVDGEELTGLRGGHAIASNTLEQHSANSIEGATNVTGGNISMSDNALSGSQLSVNLVNTGNNAALQASAAITVNITSSP